MNLNFNEYKFQYPTTGYISKFEIHISVIMYILKSTAQFDAEENKFVCRLFVSC